MSLRKILPCLDSLDICRGQLRSLLLEDIGIIMDNEGFSPSPMSPISSASEWISPTPMHKVGYQLR
ncbi:hypothetical protein ACS0TY_013027 [Phlomoides rotata]